jgi:pSer/pThr/pTyr-binding forkhead associated (FHA) protein
MPVEPFACLYIEKGEPYHAGTCLLLESDETVIGRPSHRFVPDIAFINAFVSRRHLVIRHENGKAVLYDLDSKHGTEVNGIALAPNTPHTLQASDKISLAQGMVVMRYSNYISEMTLEIEADVLAEHLQKLQAAPTLPAFRVDREKRLCYINGESVFMSDKEWRLFLMLYDQTNVLVTNEAIKCEVWPERSLDPEGVPDVGNEELSSLMYRIRRKLQKSNYEIHTIRGCGYILETQHE